jgi:hypothetical protein
MSFATSTASSLDAAIPHPGERRSCARRRPAKRSRSSARSTASNGVLDRARELERRLPAELDDDALGPLAVADGEHRLRVERLEVEPVGGVVVGRHRLGVAVDHDGLVAELAERPHGVDAAVVELDALADAVRPGAEDDDARLRARRRCLLRFAPGRVVVVGGGLDLSAARVDAPVHRPDAAVAAARAHDGLRHVGGGRDLGVGDAEPLEPQPVVRDELLDVGARRPEERLLDAPDLLDEERVHVVGDVGEGLPRRRGACVELTRPHRLLERLCERAAYAHRFADRLHLRAERAVGAGELLEGEARELDDDVVECRLEARRGGARQIVRDLVQRVADGELRGHLGDRIAGRLRGERRRPRHARVHLNDADLAGLARARELDVGATGVDADGADDRDRCVAQLLVRLVRERHLRSDGDRVARVRPHRVEVLDRAHDDDVVEPVAHDLELELVPAAHRLLDEHLPDRALAQADLDLAPQFLARIRKPAAVAAERECGPHDRRQAEILDLTDVGDDARARHLEAATLDRVLEQLPVLGPLDDVERRADQLDSELVEHARLGELAREVERRLAAHRRQERVGPLAAKDVGDTLEVERLEIRAVGEAGVGHDRRRVRVDDDGAEAVLAQDLQRLTAGVVELRSLADHDRPGADEADRLDVRPPRHSRPPRPPSAR